MNATDKRAAKKAEEKKAIAAKASFKSGTVTAILDATHAEVDLGGSQVVPVFLPASLASTVQVGQMARVSVQQSSYTLDSVTSPSGALVTSGSNANGHWTMFGDGTLICRNTFSMSDTSNPTSKTWTFPVAFIEGPTVMVTPNTISIGVLVKGVAYSESGTTTVKIWLYRTNTTSMNVDMLAIGRWRT